MAVSSLNDQIKRLAGLIKWDSLTSAMSLTTACIRAVLSSNNKDSRATAIMEKISEMWDWVESGSMCEMAFIKHCNKRIQTLLAIGATEEAGEVKNYMAMMA